MDAIRVYGVQLLGAFTGDNVDSLLPCLSFAYQRTSEARGVPLNSFVEVGEARSPQVS